ncbi:MAG: glycosyltransferase [Pseudomonadota bacterium]
MDQAAPRISIIIPVHNGRETIGRCLDSLIRIDHPDFEIIIVDDGSTDETPEICAGYSRVRLVRMPKGGPSKARNAGIRISRGEFVAFTDGDCIVDRDWLKELERGFTSPDMAGVGGDQKSPDDDTGTGVLIQAFLKSVGFVADYVKTGASMRETDHNPTCNAMYRKIIVEDVGGFNEDLWPGEDVELDLLIRRRGYKLIYNPAAVVAHYRPGTYRGFARMLYRYGNAQGYLVRKYGMFRPIHYVPIVAFPGLFLLLFLSLWHPLVWALPVLTWPLFVFLFRLKTRSLSSGVQFTHLMLITLTAWNVGFVGGYLTGRCGVVSS